MAVSEARSTFGRREPATPDRPIATSEATAA